MGNPNEAPRFSDKLSRRAFNAKFTAPFLTAAVGLVSVVTSCQRTDSDEAPGKKLLDEGSEALAKKAREAAGMGSPTAAPLQAKEMTPRPTMAAPDAEATTAVLQKTVVAQETKIASLSAAAKTPEPAKPTEKPKGKGDFEITLKPQELHRALLTTPFNPDDLPKGFELKGNQAGNLDITFNQAVPFNGIDQLNLILGKTTRAFNTIGQANILITDKNLLTKLPSIAGVLASIPTAGISYVIFSKEDDAKALNDVFQTQVSQSPQTLQDFAHTASVRTIKSPYSTHVACTVLVKNVFLAGVVMEMEDYKNKEPEAILLAKAGLKHLQKVGNPGR